MITRRQGATREVQVPMANSHVTDKDLGWKAIVKRIQAANDNLNVRVGIQGTEAAAKHAPQTPLATTQKSKTRRKRRPAGFIPDLGSAPTNVLIGAVHEFGSIKRNIPSRPFFRSTFDERFKRYQKRLDKVVGDAMVDGDYKVEGGLLRLGNVYRSDIIRKIKRKEFLPLSEETRKRRKGDTPLWDTGQLINSLSTVLE